MPVDSIQQNTETEGQPGYLSPSETFRVRCPSCRKLYLVQFSDIQEAKPRFECIQCHSRFWLPLEDLGVSGEISGIPIQFKESPRKVQSSAPRVVEKGPETEVARPLKEKWQKVLGNYGDLVQHEEFIAICQRENDLAFAARMYGSMKQLMPSDEQTQSCLKKLAAIGTVQVEMAARPHTPSFKRRKSRIRITHLPYLLGAGLVVFGLITPMFRNIAGLGAALLFASIAAHLQFRRKS